METKNNLWIFNFAMEKEDGSEIEMELAEDLLDFINDWAEFGDYKISGEFFAPNKTETKRNSQAG